MCTKFCPFRAKCNGDGSTQGGAARRSVPSLCPGLCCCCPIRGESHYSNRPLQSSNPSATPFLRHSIPPPLHSSATPFLPHSIPPPLRSSATPIPPPPLSQSNSPCRYHFCSRRSRYTQSHVPVDSSIRKYSRCCVAPCHHPVSIRSGPVARTTASGEPW